ncbi:MAG: hypothetical protein ACM3W7_12480 [Acidobacteriota bacterium]
MGWRAWDNYEREAEARRHAFPFVDRYDWVGAIVLTLILAFIAFLFLANHAHAQAAKLTDEQVAAQIVRASRAAYYATGHPCACPDDRMRNGSACGNRSAYVRPGGASPKCSPQDVSAADIAVYRRSHH